MIQFYYKASEITEQEWALAYNRIRFMLETFPLRLLRIERVEENIPKLDTLHVDLICEQGTADEHLSFYGDFMSLTNGPTITFYKHWHKQVELVLQSTKYTDQKPITWAPATPFLDTGSFPEANGITTAQVWDTSDTAYESAVLAIGIMLENLLPKKVMLLAPEQKITDLQEIISWLDTHFQEEFELPIYFDKERLLHSFIKHYEKPKDAVGRLEHLYPKRFKQNMAFAIKHLGYDAAFDFYAEVLSIYSFGTFGFMDVVNPWLAVTEDLESTLKLIAASLQILKDKKGDEHDEANKEKIAQYDLTEYLKRLLGQYILWTPSQREQFAPFYTSQNALETGREDMMGTLLRMTGYRVDISPIYATSEELFEAFLYHAPKNAAIFKEIIEEWYTKNEGAFEKLKHKLTEIEEVIRNRSSAKTKNQPTRSQVYINAYLEQYPPHEQYFYQKAIALNPTFIRLETGIKDMHELLENMQTQEQHRGFITEVKAESLHDKFIFIHYRANKLSLGTHPDFEAWIQTEDNENVMLHLRILMALKLSSAAERYIRFRVLWDRKYWEVWRS